MTILYRDRIVDFDGQKLRISFPYNSQLVEAVRQLPERRFISNDDNGAKYWLVPVKWAKYVEQFARQYGFVVQPLAQKTFDGAQSVEPVEKPNPVAIQPKIPVELRNGVRVTMGNRTLFQHQKKGIVFLAEKQRAILADDMGLGKTTQSLVAACLYGIPIVIVCPASLRENWRREAQIVGVDLAEVYTWAKFPESLLSDDRFGKGFVIIFDEAHYAQAGRKSQRGRCFLNVCEEASAVFLLTGTPMKNGLPINLEPLLIAVQHPIVAQKSYYEKWYCNARATKYSKWDCSGAAHLDELHERIKDKLLRRTKGECLDLPPFLRQMRKAEATKETSHAYDSRFLELREMYMSRLASGEILSGAEALVMLTHLREASSMAKVKATVEICEEVVEQGGQIVVFCAFDASVQGIRKALTAQHIQVTGMTGESDPRERQDAIDRFQSGEYKVFLTTFGTGGVGVNLHAAQTVVLHDRPWTPADCEQAESRLHRYGQKSAVQSIWVQYGDVDDKIDDILQQKAERIAKVLAGQRKTMRGVDFMHDVVQEVLPEVFRKSKKVAA